MKIFASHVSQSASHSPVTPRRRCASAPRTVQGRMRWAPCRAPLCVFRALSSASRPALKREPRSAHGRECSSKPRAAHGSGGATGLRTAQRATGRRHRQVRPAAASTTAPAHRAISPRPSAVREAPTLRGRSGAAWKRTFSVAAATSGVWSVRSGSKRWRAIGVLSGYRSCAKARSPAQRQAAWRAPPTPTARARARRTSSHRRSLRSERRSASVRALTHCDLFVLTRERWEGVIVAYPRYEERLKEVIVMITMSHNVPDTKKGSRR